MIPHVRILQQRLHCTACGKSTCLDSHQRPDDAVTLGDRFSTRIAAFELEHRACTPVASAGGPNP